MLLALAAALLAATPVAADTDTDRDGLPDFQEIHKYRTDPERADSDGDGTPDGDWNERREYAYSVRALIQVMKPWSEDVLQDDYQDARVIFETDEHVELEVVVYPLNTCGEAIEPDPKWRKSAKRMRAWLEPGATTNWDADMRRELTRELKQAGIDVDELDDATLVRRLASWSLEHAEFVDMHTAYALHFPEGDPEVHPGLEEKFEGGKGDPGWSIEEQLEHEIYGKGMFEHGTRGTCTSSAIYLTTVMRAAGVPARMILTIPVVDASDPRSRDLVEHGIRHPKVREDLLAAIEHLGSSFAAHTYNEVFVGGRWRRLNYAELGQNVLDRGFMGLMVHVHTFDDLATAGLGETWGYRHPNRTYSRVFRHNNPYACLALSDAVGEHSGLSFDALAEDEPDGLTIARVYWFDSKERPRGIDKGWPNRDGSGHVLMHVSDDLGFEEFQRVFNRLDKDFRLRDAKGGEVSAKALQAFWINPGEDCQEFYLRIPPSEYSKMKRGVEYALEPVNAAGEGEWHVGGRLVLER